MEIDVVELEHGLHLEARGARLAFVDTSHGIIEVATRQGGTRSFGASHEGVAAAAKALHNLCLFFLRTAGALPAGSSLPPPLRLPLIAALRRSAAAREPAIVRVEERVAAERATPLVFSRAVLRARYFVEDVLRFRPAAIAAAYVEDRLPGAERVDVVDRAALLLSRWRTLFAPHGRTNRAVQKTLAEIADDASGEDLWELARVHLERPVKSGLHLKILAERSRVQGKHRQEHLSLIQHAEPDELVELRSRVSEALFGEGLSEAEENHLLAEAIANGGSRESDGRLGQVVERSIVDGRAQLKASSSGPLGLCPLPPLPPPPGARQLRTALDIVREGQAMRHCVGAHAQHALAGELFIFHIEIDGRPITVEVDLEGDVLDAAGFANDRGPAAMKAREIFEAWGDGFPGRD